MEYLVIFTSLLNFSGSLAYIRDTLKGRSQPNRVSFFLWGTSALIGAAAGFAQGVTWAALPVFMAGFGPMLVFLASFFNPKAYWKLSTFDWFCGALSALALVLWLLTKNADVAIILSILSDGIAALPTLRKSWTHPHSETLWAYGAGVISALGGLVVAETYTFSETAFLFYLLVANLAILALILLGRRRLIEKVA